MPYRQHDPLIAPSRCPLSCASRLITCGGRAPLAMTQSLNELSDRAAMLWWAAHQVGHLASCVATAQTCHVSAQQCLAPVLTAVGVGQKQPSGKPLSVGGRYQLGASRASACQLSQEMASCRPNRSPSCHASQSAAFRCCVSLARWRCAAMVRGGSQASQMKTKVLSARHSAPAEERGGWRPLPAPPRALPSPLPRPRALASA